MPNRISDLLPASGRPRSFLLPAACLVVLLWGLAAAEDFLVPLSLSALLAFAMTPAVRLLRRARFPEWASVVLAALLVLVPLGLVVYLAVSEIQSLVQEWPRLYQSLLASMAELRGTSWAQRLHLAPYLDPATLSGRMGDYAGSGVKMVLGGMLKILSAGTSLVLIIFFAVMMLASRTHLERGASYAFSSYGEPGSSHLVNDITDMIQVFLTARFGLTAITGGAGWLLMMGFGLPYAFLMGLFYGLMTWVPAVGMFVALVPPVAVGVAAGKSAGHMVALVLALVVVWAVQDHLLTPKWLGGKLKLNFFATYLALFAGERLWGAWGMFLSVPLLGVLRIVFAASEDLKPIAFLFSDDEEPAEEETSVPTAAQLPPKRAGA